MNPNILSALIFLATFGLLLSLAFLIFEARERKKLRARLSAIQDASDRDPEVQLLRQDVLRQASLMNRLLLSMPVARRMQLFIEQAAIDMTLSMLAALSFFVAVFAFLAALLANLPVLAAAAIGLAGAAVPSAVVGYKRMRRLRRFEEQFPEAMDMLARAVTAGYAFTSGLELIAQEMPEPLAREFRITYDQQNLGLPLREALNNLARRIPLADVRIFVALLQIQQDSGGNLAEMLNNLSQVIRERFKLLRQVRVYTAEGRLSMIVLTALPPVAAVLFLLTNPDYLKPLIDTPLGHRLIVAAIILQIIGFLVIRRIVHLKV